MDNNIFNEIGTTLDLNGPILSYSEQPTGSTGVGTAIDGTGGASVSFTGIATGVDPGTGYLSYQWYEVDVGKLSDSTYVTGTASTGPVGTAATLTISNLITPSDNQRKFYLVTDYVASAYGTGRSTGNAWNEPLTSGIATVTVTPLIEVVAQPTEGVQSLINENAIISVNADLTDSYFADDLLFQWYLNGELAEDGVKSVTTTTTASIAGAIEKNYTSPSILTIPSTSTDIQISIAGGQGGHGGYDGGGPGGNGGQGISGRFALPDGGKQLSLYVGKIGNGGESGGPGAYGLGGDNGGPGNIGDGGDGGGAGARGWSGGGAGGGAASYVANPTGTFLVAGGGGGGGGGSHNRGAPEGSDATPFGAGNVSEFRNRGGRGTTKSGDGGGGGGGGGGTGSPSGGGAGHDNSHGGTGGGGGGSAVNPGHASAVGGTWLNRGDGYINVKYTGYTDTSVTTIKNTTLSGTTSNSLTIKCDTVGVQTCQCKISSATASNSPIWTDVTNFVTTSTLAQLEVIVEGIGISDTATLTPINLANGDFTFDTTLSQVSTGGITKYYSFYSPNRDIDVEMDLYGGKGDNKNQHSGGEGGYSRIRFTMEKQIEYVLVGLTPDIGAPFLYRKAELIACVGQGGEAGTTGRGGAGGGINVAGERGRGYTPGNGGTNIDSGSLGSNGTFGSAYTGNITVYPGDNKLNYASALPLRAGGRTIRCTKGVYWAQQGIGACDDMSGTNVFRLPDGTKVTNTALITRGFKAGYNIMETAGNAFSAQLGGHGGNGATGGDGTDNNGGGGGGSGYASGFVTVVDTQLGGSSGDAKVLLRAVT